MAKKKPASESGTTPAPRVVRRTRKVAKPPATAAKPGKCVVCGADVAPFSTEELCWVCRRLKISAWRDIEGQAAMQE